MTQNARMSRPLSLDTPLLFPRSDPLVLRDRGTSKQAPMGLVNES